jgi:hypothetical protein
MRAISLADGRYRIGGLDVGGPYSVSARRIGSPRQTRAGLFLTLGQQLRVDLVLEREPVTLSAVQTRGTGERVFSRAHTGTEGFLSDSMIRQLPVINRDLYDLVRLIPQTSTWFPLTASGAGPRVNNIRIDGVGDQVPASNWPPVPCMAAMSYRWMQSKSTRCCSRRMTCGTVASPAPASMS